MSSVQCTDSPTRTWMDDQDMDWPTCVLMTELSLSLNPSPRHTITLSYKLYPCCPDMSLNSRHRANLSIKIIILRIIQIHITSSTYAQIKKKLCTFNNFNPLLPAGFLNVKVEFPAAFLWILLQPLGFADRVCFQSVSELGWKSN